MTTVGKIFVFLNLLLALVVGAFVAFAYAGRTHWQAEFNSVKNLKEVAEANARTYQSELEKTKQEDAAQIAKIKTELQNAQQDLKAANDVIAQLRADMTKLQNKSRQESALSTQYTAEVEKRQEDVIQLRATLQQERVRNSELVKKNAELTDKATVAQIERQAVQDQNNRLEAQLRQVYREMARMRANGGLTTMARASGKNPPAENIEGQVKNTDSSSGLMTIDIGSDAGLQKGHTLELFRLNPPKYLGTVRIVDTEAHQAVVQPLRKLPVPPQAGDHVASRIQGG